MKRNLYILLPALGLSAALLAACGSQSTPDSVTQQITSNQDALAAGASSSTVQITENKDDDASLPAAGETVPLLRTLPCRLQQTADRRLTSVKQMRKK